MNKEKPVLKSWSKLPDLTDAQFQPEHPGLAGAVVGLSNKNLLIAGGSNFLDAKPWDGGTKSYHKTIYSYDTAEENGMWKKWHSTLPHNLGYSACVSVGGKIISVGGENEEGLLKKVYSIEVNDTVLINRLPDFPVKITNAGIANINRQIYVVGGITENGATANLYRLDLDKKESGWIKLQDIPLAFTNGVVVAQNDGREDALYVLGGRSRTAELTTFFSNVRKYLPSKNSWEKVSTIRNGKDTITLAAGIGVAYGKEHIILFGGDNGEKYNKTESFINAANEEENAERRAEINKAKVEHLTNHPGFSRDVLAFNTIENSWEKIDEIPYPASVTTVLIKEDNTIFIPNGEIKPGVRTPQIITVKFQ